VATAKILPNRLTLYAMAWWNMPEPSKVQQVSLLRLRNDFQLPEYVSDENSLNIKPNGYNTEAGICLQYEKLGVF
jgi:hypothetical protein